MPEAIPVIAPVPGVAPAASPPQPAPTETPPAAPPVEIPQKFQKADGTLDQERFLKSYQDMERKMGGGPTRQGLTIETPQAIGPVRDDMSLDEAVLATGLDPFEVGKTFRETGALTPQQYKTLKQGVGMPKGVVDAYLRTVLKLQEQTDVQTRAMAHERAGGEEQWGTVLAWAATALQPEEITRINAMLHDPINASIAVDALNARYNAAAGAAGAKPLINATGAGHTPGPQGGYSSQREIRAALMDPRMSETSRVFDANYQKSVMARMAATPDPTLLPA